jgi:hypothetical protein
MTTHYDRTRVTFHRGNAFSPEGIAPEPFATLTVNDLIERDLIDLICGLIRTHVNETHMDFCNIKLTTEDWDA